MAEPQDLCSLQDVKKRAPRIESTKSDEQIEELITIASEAIIDHTERELAPKTTSPEARKFLYRHGGILTLTQADARTVTQVRVDTDTTSPTILVAGVDYFLRPVRSKWGVYTYLSVPGMYAAAHGREFEVTGQWGFDEVPLIAMQACVVAVRAWLTREGSFGLTDDAQGNPPPSPQNTYSLPAASRRIVEPLRRQVVA